MTERDEPKPTGYHQLLEDLRQPVCSVCRATECAARRCMEGLLEP
jgi:hypothetical protein